MTNPDELLMQKIEASVEQLVREHFTALEKSAAQAVRRGMRRVMSAPSTSKKSAKSRRPRAVERTQAELAALEEDLYQALCAQPGETMSVLAEAVKSTSEKLTLPMRRLRATGRIRSVGQRTRARYFPIKD